MFELSPFKKKPQFSSGKFVTASNLQGPPFTKSLKSKSNSLVPYLQKSYGCLVAYSLYPFTSWSVQKFGFKLFTGWPSPS